MLAVIGIQDIANQNADNRELYEKIKKKKEAGDILTDEEKVFYERYLVPDDPLP